MAEARSDRLYDHWLESNQKFDYFVAGLALALVGYLGSNTPATVLGWNAGSLQLGSLAVLLLSAVCGVKRIESVLTTVLEMHRRVQLEESFQTFTERTLAGGTHVNTATGQVLTAEDVRKETEKLAKMVEKATKFQNEWVATARVWYHWRNWLLVGGLSLLVIGRWLASAQQTLR